MGLVVYGLQQVVDETNLTPAIRLALFIATGVVVYLFLAKKDLRETLALIKK